jgi:hypothetical protein
MEKKDSSFYKEREKRVQKVKRPNFTMDFPV